MLSQMNEMKHVSHAENMRRMFSQAEVCMIWLRLRVGKHSSRVGRVAPISYSRTNLRWIIFMSAS